ncbi:retron St85 family effector protein [Leclercia sp.]|uniref:retron St85 family effector protein n=1 Tax=Leclercia sp. TaxID=1898428 RepID=UPI0028A11C69|nr:retron St85 family effector protein [Leclercia sp.]
MDDIREDFILCIDPTELRLENLPNFVFICGGVRNPVDAPKPGSMRDALLLRISEKDRQLNDRIREAEEFQDWLEHSQVDNLIDFEIVLADLASSVVLVVEGLGAYAELGSFSIIESISSKLITIFNMNTVIDKSFINLGVIKYLEDNKRTVLRYNWGVEYVTKPLRDSVTLNLKDSIEDIYAKVDVILTKLKEEIDKKTQSSIKFNRDIKGHICLVIADLIYLFSALKVGEIKNYLTVGFNIELPVKKIKEYLYILENLNYITKENSGDVFYVSTLNNNGFIKYRYNDDKKTITSFENVDDVRAKTIIYYRESDASRSDVLNV